MELSSITLIVNLTCSIIALFFSGRALVISSKNRMNGLREKLFYEQLSAFKKLSFKMTRFESLIMDYNADKKTSGDEYEEIREKIWNASDDFQDYYAAMEIFIPDEVDKQFITYHKYLDSVIKKINSGEEEIDIVELSNENYAAQESIREFIRLDNLSKENKRLSKSRYLRK